MPEEAPTELSGGVPSAQGSHTCNDNDLILDLGKIGV